MILLSCVSRQSIITEEPSIKTEPKLLFLNYEIVKLNDEKNISLINQITADGRLKGKMTSKNNTSIGDLECIVLDKDLNQLEKHSIKNPLKKTVEFINDSGNFEKKILDLDRVQFSIKLQQQPKAKYVVISEITKTTIKKHITTKID